MGVYTNAVNAYNTTNLGYSQIAANQMSSLGSGIGDILGLFKVAKGGPVGYADGGDVNSDDSRIVSPAKSSGYPPLPPRRPLTLPPMTGIPGRGEDRRDLPTPMPSYMLPRDMGGGPPGYEEWETQPPRAGWITGDQFNAARTPAPPPAFAAQERPTDAFDHYMAMQNLRGTMGNVDAWARQNTPRGLTPPIPSVPPLQTELAQGGPAQQPTMGIPPGGTPGGPIPTHASPSMGAATDDVDAKLTAGEFVIPKDVAQWKGHEHFVKQIDKAREEHQQFKGRGDIGGEPARGIPQRPTFVSRPAPISRQAMMAPRQGIPMPNYQ
jgi:hypothetical protein